MLVIMAGMIGGNKGGFQDGTIFFKTSLRLTLGSNCCSYIIFYPPHILNNGTGSGGVHVLGWYILMQ